MCNICHTSLVIHLHVSLHPPTCLLHLLCRPDLHLLILGNARLLKIGTHDLGHPAFRICFNVLSIFNLPVSSNNQLLTCSACHMSKSKQLHFSLSSTRVNHPLELIYTDVWGPAPMFSTNGNKFYVSFLDAYSRYTWLFPISHKSDVCSIFLQFQKYVERFFNSKIKIIQSDWGGEYRSLNKILTNLGISHRLSCPHTHQQNGAVERKHRHIVETGLALLSHAHVPFEYWEQAFQTACYLINRMPTPLLKNSSSYEILFQTSPDYKLLRIFGCACWPNLRPYNSHKLQPRSVQCIFLGYSIRHKGYQCFNLKNGRLYISRDVVFEETIFPLQTPLPNETQNSPENSQSVTPSPHPIIPQNSNSNSQFVTPLLSLSLENQHTFPTHIVPHGSPTQARVQISHDNTIPTSSPTAIPPLLTYLPYQLQLYHLTINPHLSCHTLTCYHIHKQTTK
jgi:hypothetical protein